MIFFAQLTAKEGTRVMKNFKLHSFCNKNHAVHTNLTEPSRLVALQDMLHLFDEISHAPLEVISFIDKKDVDMVSTFQNVFKKISTELKRNQSLQHFLTEILTYDFDLFIHSLNVTVYSLALAKKLKMNENAMYSIAISSLLHDIGKISVPTEILYKPGKLTDKEFEIIKSHSKFGYTYLSTQAPLPSFVMLTTIQHHERIDGSGYPFGIKGNDIHPFAKLIAITDVFDALTSDRCYKEAMTTEAAISILKKDYKKFEPNMLGAFIDLIQIYPIGSEVILNDSRVGIIKAQTDNPYRPIIEFKIDSINGKIPFTKNLNLTEKNELFIQRITPILNFATKIKVHKVS